jgi:hypothetical protein
VTKFPFGLCPLGLLGLHGPRDDVDELGVLRYGLVAGGCLEVHLLAELVYGPAANAAAQGSGQIVTERMWPGLWISGYGMYSYLSHDDRTKLEIRIHTFMHYIDCKDTSTKLSHPPCHLFNLHVLDVACHCRRHFTVTNILTMSRRS